MGLLEIAEGEAVGSKDDEERVYRAIVQWIGDDERMQASARTKLRKAPKGSDLFDHTLTCFNEPMVGDNSDAEKKFRLFDYNSMFGGDEEKMPERFDEFTNIIGHLSESRQGDPAEWVEHFWIKFHLRWQPSTTATCAS